jgi:hypothetical protein
MRRLFIMMLYLPALSAFADEAARFNIYDKNFVSIVATAESTTTIDNNIRHYSIKYFDTSEHLIYEQAVSYDLGTLDIVAGGFIDHQYNERASYVVTNHQTIITTQTGKNKPQTVVRRSTDYDYSETILLRVLRNLAQLSNGEKRVLHMFVPSANDTMAFVYFREGEMTLRGRSYIKVRAYARNWFINLFLPKIVFLVTKDGSSIPAFFGPADFSKSKTHGVWIVDTRVDKPAAMEMHPQSMPPNNSDATSDTQSGFNIKDSQTGERYGDN